MDNRLLKILEKEAIALLKERKTIDVLFWMA